jgi:hypothetical protein
MQKIIPRKKMFSKLGSLFRRKCNQKPLFWKVNKICFDITIFGTGTYSLKRIRQFMQILKRQNSINDEMHPKKLVQN